MHLCFIDFETYWDEHHSLSKMSPIEYVLSPKTELQLLSVKVDHYPTDVFVGEDEIKKIGSHRDFWRDKFVIAHNNSGFDAMLAAWRLGIRPAMWGCTLAMARPLYAKTVGLSLAKQVAHHGLGVKDNRALIQTRGKRLADFTQLELDDMIRYNRDGDTEQCAALFHVLRRFYSFEELWHIDCNIRMLVEPEFELDVPMLETALSIERSRKHKSLLDLAHLLQPEGLDWADEPAVAAWVNEQMQSSAKFSAILESRGVDVPMKWSKTSPDKEIPAIAKTDEAMEELLDHDDEVVAAAAAARLSAKSTQLETRIQLFLNTYKAAGKLPVPAHYCGADTTGRDSGWLYNMLNLPRVNPDKPKVSDALRNSVKAPKGRVVLVRDLSGIELRVNHTLWKVQRSMDNWKRKPDYDLYRDTGGHMYNKAPEDVLKAERHYAKILELACLAEGTLVLTDSGLKPIERVSLLDCVWDGMDWVAHRGLVDRGERETWTAHGLTATPDHEVWTGASFVEWRLVCADEALVSQATSSVNSPWSDGSGSSTNPVNSDTTPCVGASAGGKALCVGKTSSVVEAPGATAAPNSARPSPECATAPSRMCPAVRRDAASSVGCVPQFSAATTQTTRGTPTTALAESRCALSGANQSEPSWSTSAPSPGGTLAGSIWTASTTAAGMSLATSASPPEPRTPGTGEPSRPWSGGWPNSKQRSRVYDLAECGPRNRFAVWTDRGLVLVHNCGYQQGGKTFRSTARVQGGLRLTLEQANHGVQFWRGRYPEIAGKDGGWAQCHDALNYIARGDKVAIDPWGMCTTEKDAIVLPSGRRILYPNLRQQWVDKWDTVDGQRVKTKELAWVYDDGRKLVFIYGGKVDENIVQALARDIIFGQALAIFKRTRMRPKHKVYDELVYLPTPAQAPDLMEIVGEEMRKAPSWWPELTLWSEGDIAQTYGAAK